MTAHFFAMNRRDILKSLIAVPASPLLALAGRQTELTNQGKTLQAAFVDKDVSVPMRDGLHLATDIYLPAAGGKPLDAKLAVILVRTSYNKESYAQDFI